MVAVISERKLTMSEKSFLERILREHKVENLSNITLESGNLDDLINQLALTKAQVAIIYGSKSFNIIRAGKYLDGMNPPVADAFFKIYGMHFPMFLKNFYGFLVPNLEEVQTMPAKLSEKFYERVKNNFVTPVGEDWVVPLQEGRGDLFIINEMIAKGFEYDENLNNHNSFAIYWNDAIKDFLVFCRGIESKKAWLQTGLGMVATMEEIKGLKKSSLEHIFQVAKLFGARFYTKGGR